MSRATWCSPAKTELARLMLGRALDAGVPAAWVTADEAYGKDGKFRDWLEQRRAAYVVAVASNQAVPGSTGTSRADVLAAHAPDQAWKRRSCGNGAKGPRIFDWAAASLPEDGTEPPGWSRYLLVRRSLTRNGKGQLELAYYLCAAPAGTADEELIRVAGSRWAIEMLPDAKPRPAWTSTRSAATTPGTGTSPSPCSRTPTCPSPPRTAQKPWQRPYPGHARRGPPSPGTPDHDHVPAAPQPGPGPTGAAPPAPR